MEHVLVFLEGFLKSHGYSIIASGMMAKPQAFTQIVMKSVAKIEQEITGLKTFDAGDNNPLPYRAYEDAAASFTASLMGGDYPQVDDPHFEYAEIAYTAVRAQIYASIKKMF